jgi:hypothetical protein
MDLRLDKTGSTYLLGTFKDRVQLGSFVLDSPNMKSIFVSKIDPAGTILWARKSGGSRDISLASLVVAPGGESYLLGEMKGGRLGMRCSTTGPKVCIRPVSVCTFGRFKLNCALPAACVFLVRLDRSGQFSQARIVASSTWSLTVEAAALHPGAGQITIAGKFAERTTFGSQTLRNRGHPDHDLYVARISTSGETRWAQHLPQTTRAEVSDLDLGPAGGLYLLGRFSGSLRLGGEVLKTAGAGELFVARQNPKGKILWARQSTGSYSTFAGALAADHLGGVHLVGSFKERLDLGLRQLRSPSTELYLASFDASGTLLRAWQSTGNCEATAYDISVDGTGLAHITGALCGTATLGSIRRAAVGEDDALLLRLKLPPGPRPGNSPR